MKTSTVIYYSLGIGLTAYLIDRNLNTHGIGKIEDYNPPGSGRIDRHWGRLQPNKNFVRRKYSLKPYHLDPAKAAHRFNLAGIEFGNWMSQQDRVDHLAAMAQSLDDLAKVLKVPFNKIGRNKRLSMALGARGRSSAVAHYESAYYTINITKKMGGVFGALGHEYGHFIDNYVSTRYLKERRFASGGRSTRKKTDYDLLSRGKGIVYHFEALFDTLFYDSKGNETQFYHDQLERSNYYNHRTEVFARTMETYIVIRLKELGLTSRYLSMGMTPDMPPIKLVKKGRRHIEALINYTFK